MNTQSLTGLTIPAAVKSDDSLVTIVAARSLNNIIGKGDKIPWRVKGEQKLFKELTIGGCLIMGRKTFETIGRPLPGRQTIIITRNESFSSDGCECTRDIPSALVLARSKNIPIHIVGGGEIYRQALELNIVDLIHLTTIQTEVEGDVYFPEILLDHFIMINDNFFHSNIDFRYECYQRVNRTI